MVKGTRVVKKLHLVPTKLPKKSLEKKKMKSPLSIGLASLFRCC